MEKTRTDRSSVGSHFVLLTLLILIAAMHFAKYKQEANPSARKSEVMTAGSYYSERR